MRKVLASVLLSCLALTACSEGNDSADVGDRVLVNPRSLPGAPVPPAGSPLQVDIVARGGVAKTVASSGGTKLVATSQDWRTVWEESQPSGDNRPDVDFANNRVIVVARDLPSGGWRVEPTTVKAQGNRVAIAINVIEPGPNCMTSQAFQQPWVALRVPYWAEGADVVEQRIVGAAC